MDSIKYPYLATAIDDEKIVIPNTIDDLLDICANIARHVDTRWSGKTLSWLFPAGHRPTDDMVVFFNSGDMPFEVWDGAASKAILKDLKKDKPHWLYASRVKGRELVHRYPVLALGQNNPWWYWVDASAEFTKPVTQFLGKRI